MKVVALVCARGGSKGIPGKNLRLLGGRSLVAWAVEQALAAKQVTRVLVSTDAEDIARAATAVGADVPFIRPKALAQDDTAEWLVWRHALEWLDAADGHLPEALLVVPPTAPLRAVEDLDRCVEMFGAGGADVVITVTGAHRNPYFNMVRTRADGTVAPVMAAGQQPIRRQDAPAVYDMTTVAYVADPVFVMQHDGMFAGRVRAVTVPHERAIDIDTSLDLQVAECLFSKRYEAR